MLGAIFIVVAFLLFFIKLLKWDEPSYPVAISLFISAWLMFLGFYFSTFPYQAISMNAITVQNSVITQIVNTTITKPIGLINSNQFVMFLTFIIFWDILTILLGIATMLDTLKEKAEEASKIFQ